MNASATLFDPHWFFWYNNFGSENYNAQTWKIL